MNSNAKTIAVLMSVAALCQPNAVMAVNVPLDVSNQSNGITDIFSTTFDGSIDPDCTGAADPDACDFFGGQPPAGRAITIAPNPSLVANGAPRGITPQPPDGSFLDMDLGAGNAQLTLNTGVVYIESLAIIISAGTPDETNIQAYDIGIQLKNFAPVTVPVDSDGVAVFEIDTAPAISADFSTFSVIVDIVNDCTGNLCALIPILTLDMIRFRMIVDYDSTFGSFTADFVGQSANNSFVSMTLNSGIPTIEVTDSVPPPDDHSLPFGDVTEMTQSDQTVTVTNTGTGDLAVSPITMPMDPPFNITSDMCSGQAVAPGASCVIGVRFAPQATGPFASSFDIPSDDASSPNVTVSLSGNGTALPVPDITITDSIPPPDNLEMPYGDVTIGTFRDETVTITNDGTGDLIVDSIGQNDALAPPFSILNNTCLPLPATLAPTASCTLTVRFDPATAGAVNDSFDISSNDTDESPATMMVSGTGTVPPMPDITVTDSIDPEDDLQLPFGDIWEQFTIDETITITNDGNADLLLGSISTLAAPYRIVNDPCSGQTIMPTMSCTVDVSFNPTTLGTFTDSIDIPSNDPDEPTVTMSLSGAGVPPDPGEKLSTEPSGSNGGFFGMAVGPQSLLVLLLIPALRARRRRAGAGDRHIR